MPLLRFQVSMGADSAFAQDRIVNTLHFNDLLGSDEEQLCQDILDVYQALFLNTTPREVRVTAYGVGAPPQLPITSVVEGEGLFPATASNRELACCLSYFNVRSDPRKRGRLYMPVPLSSPTPSGARPGPGTVTKLLDFGDGLTGIGGVDVQWGVYSRMNSAFYPTVGMWVDDAWDVVRSRGLSPTTRTERLSGS